MTLGKLPPLAGLTALQYLNLRGCRQLQALPPLAGLTGLQRLDLSECEQLQALPPLAGLTGLQSLHLSWCEQLQALPPLAGLTGLRHLDLHGCRQLQALPPLAGLAGLRHLDLHGCQQLQDLSPLAGLTGLQSLNLHGCQQLQDLSPLAGLTGLRGLTLSECGQLQDLSPLTALAQLKAFSYVDAGLLDCAPGAQPLASWGQLEGIYANRLLTAPSELGSSNIGDNALPRLRGWQEDLAAGEAPNSTLKLYVLGNGRVGKTQLCRRLCGEPFDPSIPSTHGVRLGQLRLVEARGDQPTVEAHFWDFGGQDIYLGTHALFLDERAIYVIAWNPQYECLEKPQASEPQSAPQRNWLLVYWLEYVRSLAGPQAPVIVVQTQSDRELEVRPAPMPAEHGFERLRITSSSAQLDDGLERLQLELKSAARYQLERYGKVRLPASWVAVDEELRTRIGQKTLSKDEFDELCHAKHGAAVSDVVLEYLHRSGLVFWHEGLFGNQVVLDLAWALAGIYAVLERNIVLPEIRRRNGYFSPQLLGFLVWQNHSEAERALFFTLMEQCQICFKVAEEDYIAPALLPALAEREAAMQQVWHEAVPEAIVRLDYAFLHEGVLRAMLCGIGEKAGVHAVYWAYGVCFYDAEQKSTVRIHSQVPDPATGQPGGRIKVEAVGPGATSLASYLVESIQRLNIGRPPQVTWEAGQINHAAQVKADIADPREQAFTAVNPARPPRLPGEAQPVYVSYAWGGESEALVDELERRLPESFKLIRDKHTLRPGDWISRFMAEIGRADLVVVVLSDKYVRSVYCMRELLYLFHTSQGERDILMRRIVPLLVGDLKCADVPERDVYVSYCEQKHATVDALLKKRGLGSMGEADREELLAIQDFQHRVSDLLAWVADTLMPQSSELHTQDLDAAIQWLQQRTLALSV